MIAAAKEPDTNTAGEEAEAAFERFWSKPSFQRDCWTKADKKLAQLAFVAAYMACYERHVKGATAAFEQYLSEI